MAYGTHCLNQSLAPALAESPLPAGYNWGIMRFYLRTLLFSVALVPSLLAWGLRDALISLVEYGESRRRGLAPTQLRLSTPLVVLGIAPPVLAVTWFLTHSVVGMVGWYAFAAFFVVAYRMLRKSQSFPHETRGSRMWRRDK